MNYPKIKKPTVPGYYWARRRPSRILKWTPDHEIVHVKFVDDHGFVETMGFLEFLEIKHFIDWHGPIPRIQEGEQ